MRPYIVLALAALLVLTACGAVTPRPQPTTTQSTSVATTTLPTSPGGIVTPPTATPMLTSPGGIVIPPVPPSPTPKLTPSPTPKPTPTPKSGIVGAPTPTPMPTPTPKPTPTPSPTPTPKPTEPGGLVDTPHLLPTATPFWQGPDIPLPSGKLAPPVAAPQGSASPTGETTCPTAFLIKANVSAGQPRYYTPEMGSYKQARPAICFATEQGARAAGYTKAQ